MKKIQSTAVLALLLSTFVPSFALAASDDPIDNANVNLDYVYHMDEDEDVQRDWTDQSESDNGEYTVFFDHGFDEDEDYYYFGSLSPFDRLYFDVSVRADYDNDEPDFVWEYNDNGTWKDLSVSDNTDDFTDSGEGYIAFSLPSNWDEDSVDGDEAYWVRMSIDEDPDDFDRHPAFDQISARAYTLKLTIEDEDDRDVDDLSRSDFSLDGGTDDSIYAWKNMGDGIYLLAINGSASDTSYELTIDDSRYEEKEIDLSISTNQRSYKLSLDEGGDNDNDDDDDDSDSDSDVNDDRDLISGATADFDYVYTKNGSTKNYTDEASEDDGDYVDVFHDDDGTQYLYLGMRTVFDEVYFDVDQAVDYDGSGSIKWEYYSDDDGWETLDVDDGSLDDFDDEGEYMVDFDIPSDWEELKFNSKKAYWVRIKTTSDVDDEGHIDQISARAYTLKLHVEDEDDDEVDDLSKSDFEISSGSKNSIYGFINDDDGDYLFALVVDASDTSYRLTIDDSRYEEERISVSPKTSMASYSVTLDDEGSSSSSRGDDDDRDGDCRNFRDLYGHWSRYAVQELSCMGVVNGVSSRYYRPNSSMSRAEFLKLIMLAADVDLDEYDDEGEDFRDVRSSNWYYKYVVAALELDVIDDKSYFYPNRSITRAEAVTMLVKLADLDLGSRYTRFDDVSSSAWYARYVRAAYDADLVEGYVDGTFKPSKTLTRGEGAVMAFNAYLELWD